MNLPSLSVLHGANRILPVVGSNEVTARVSHAGDIELLEGVENVQTETVLIRKGVSRVIDTAVDTATHMPI